MKIPISTFLESTPHFEQDGRAYAHARLRENYNALNGRNAIVGEWQKGTLWKKKIDIPKLRFLYNS